MERYCSTGQSLRRTGAPTEEEEEEKKKKKGKEEEKEEKEEEEEEEEEEKKKKLTEPRVLYKENKLLASLATTTFSSRTMLCVKVVFLWSKTGSSNDFFFKFSVTKHQQFGPKPLQLSCMTDTQVYSSLK